MCQVYTGAHVSLLAAGKTDYNRLPPKKKNVRMSEQSGVWRHEEEISVNRVAYGGGVVPGEEIAENRRTSAATT